MFVLDHYGSCLPPTGTWHYPQIPCLFVYFFHSSFFIQFFQQRCWNVHLSFIFQAIFHTVPLPSFIAFIHRLCVWRVWLKNLFSVLSKEKRHQSMMLPPTYLRVGMALSMICSVSLLPHSVLYVGQKCTFAYLWEIVQQLSLNISLAVAWTLCMKLNFATPCTFEQ